MASFVGCQNQGIQCLERKTMKLETDCYKCIYKRNVPGNCHIACAKPDWNMTGDKHGIKMGWFIYPLLFDPVWRTKECDNFESKDVNHAVSQVISGVVSDVSPKTE